MVFLVLGLAVYFSVREATPIQMIERDVLGERGPASVSVPTLKSTEILNVGCDDYKKEISVRALQVRLNGALCNLKTAESVSLQNETTGQPATIFRRGSSEYTTDYIQLKNGKNQMSLTYTVNDKPHKLDFVLIQ